MNETENREIRNRLRSLEARMQEVVNFISDLAEALAQLEANAVGSSKVDTIPNPFNKEKKT